jgi:predicted NUDIX family NTP pyrophosphohydrolase
MPKLSAGVLLYRRSVDALEVLLVHPGGPYWVRRDDGVWSVPKGEYELAEDPWRAALREFREEVGSDAPDGESPIPLGEIRQASGKRVTAWALEGDLDVSTIRSNTFTAEWPPRSGRNQEFPEVDRAAWFDLATARRKLVGGQGGFIDRLLEALGEKG